MSWNLIDHVTYHVSPGTLDRPDLVSFMLALGLSEVRAEESVPEGWRVRWFAAYKRGMLGVARADTTLHLVEGDWEDYTDRDRLGLGHFCVKGVGAHQYEALKATRWCVRDSGSGRIWLAFNNLRVEVRP